MTFSPTITSNYRKYRPDVKALRTATLIIELGPGQQFYEMARSWEIWEEGPPATRRIQRISADRVLFIVTWDDWFLKEPNDTP